jgi:hypothetical protein
VSFALFCVPLIVVPSALRLLACRPRDPASAARLIDLLRAAGLALAAVAVTLAAGWSAVADGANRAAWNSVSAIQVGWLAALSGCTLACAVAIRRTARSPRRADYAGPAETARARRPEPDWLADIVSAGLLITRLTGPAGKPASRALAWASDRLLPLVRRHPLAAAALIGAACAVPLTTAQSVNEGYGPGVAVIFFCITTAGVFAFVATAGWYLRIIRTERRTSASGRGLVHAAVLGAAAVPVALAFRATLWSLVGASHRSSGLGALWLLIGSAAALVFGLVLGAERILRSRGMTGRRVPRN